MADVIPIGGGPLPDSTEQDVWLIAAAAARAAGARRGVILYLDEQEAAVGRIPIGCGLVSVRAMVDEAHKDLAGNGDDDE